MKRLSEIVIDAKMNNNQDELVGFFCGLNSDLKWQHSKGLCAKSIDMDTVVDDKSKSFIDTVKLGSPTDVKDDIENFALTAVNSFIYLNNTSNNFIPFSKEAIIENADFIETMIPSVVMGDRYYLDIITGKAFTYYEDYLNVLQNQAGYGNSNRMTKVYSTPAGRAFGEKRVDAAFIDIMFYPVVISAILIVLAVIYVSVTILIH